MNKCKLDIQAEQARLLKEYIVSNNKNYDKLTKALELLKPAKDVFMEMVLLSSYEEQMHS